MTTALQVQPVKLSSPYRLSNPIPWFFAPFYRCWWHTHAYTTIIGIMLLTLLSLMVLSAHQFLRQVLSILHHRFYLSANGSSAPVKPR